jgi:hypothetical protein
LPFPKYATAEAIYKDYNERFLHIVMGDKWVATNGYSGIEAKTIRRMGRLANYAQGRQNRIQPITRSAAEIEIALADCSAEMHRRGIQSISGVDKMIQRRLKTQKP